MSGRETKNREDRKRSGRDREWDRGGDRDRSGKDKEGASVWGRDRHRSEKDGASQRDKEKERTWDQDRDKNRQRVNERDPDRDYSRHREWGDNDRRRQRDEKSSNSDANPIQGPIILLRRPTSTPAAPSPSSIVHSQSARGTEGKDLPDKKQRESGREGKTTSARCPTMTAAPPTLLQRPTTSAKPNTENTDPLKKSTETSSVEKSKPKLSAAEIGRNLLKPFNNFPEKFAIPVIDRNMKIRPISTFNFFSERGKVTGDYIIITTIGKPLTGKSTILSYLVEPLRKKKKAFKMFPDRSRSNEMESFMYITRDNLIVIEMASIFNCAAAHDLSSQQGTLENTSLTWNLKLMRWALAVSHIVLIVNDNLLDPNICELISSAEMIHPLESALGEGVYPEILFVCNKVTQSNMNDAKLLQKYEFMLSTVAGRNPRIQPNFFMLPELTFKNLERFQDFKSIIFKFVRYNRATFLNEMQFSKIPQKYNAYDWYCNAMKIWEAMQHPNYFAAYVKLFP